MKMEQMEVLDDYKEIQAIALRTERLNRLEWIIMLWGVVSLLVLSWLVFDDLKYIRWQVKGLTFLMMIVVISPTIFTFLWRTASNHVEEGNLPPLALRKTSIVFFWGLSWLLFLPCILFWAVGVGLTLVFLVVDPSSVDLGVIGFIPMMVILCIHLYYFVLTSRATDSAQKLYKINK